MSNFLEDLEAQLDAAAQAQAESRRPGRLRGIGSVAPLLLAAAVTAVVAAVVLSIGHGRSGSPAPAQGMAHVHRCASSDLKLSLGAPVVPETGEEAVLLVLRNGSRRSCVLDGYPRVRLSGPAGRLPFLYARGGGAYVTTRRPRPVRLDPGARAYFLVAKYRCDGAVRDTATSMGVFLPGQRPRFVLRLVGVGAVGLNYCRRYPGDSKIDPGNRVAVSPIEANALATRPLGPTVLRPHTPLCRSSQLRLTVGHRVSEKTEQHTRLLLLRDASAASCHIEGYPRIALLDSHGMVLGFRYLHRGDQMITNAKPANVQLAPGGNAYFALNTTYACAAFGPHNATRLRFRPPNGGQALSTAIGLYPQLNYCRGGWFIDVTPIEPTVAAISGQH